MIQLDEVIEDDFFMGTQHFWWKNADKNIHKNLQSCFLKPF